MDGATQLAPRPGVVGMRPWQENTVNLGGKTFHITATPAVLAGLPGATTGLNLTRLAVTFAIATGSFYLLEQPIILNGG